MSTIHTVKLYRPDEGETESMWDLYHAADAVEDRWSRRSTVKDLMRRLNDGELSREERRFIMRAWSVLVDGHLGFSRFMSAFSALTSTFQDPDVPYVKAKPELEQMAADAALLPVFEEAYKEAMSDPYSELTRSLVAPLMRQAIQDVMDNYRAAMLLPTSTLGEEQQRDGQ